jgi:hypothetical protein
MYGKLLDFLADRLGFTNVMLSQYAPDLLALSVVRTFGAKWGAD